MRFDRIHREQTDAAAANTNAQNPAAASGQDFQDFNIPEVNPLVAQSLVCIKSFFTIIFEFFASFFPGY